jgi:uncharacterized phage protein gp47/JayE
VKTLSRPVDYTNLGYASLREAMLDIARENMPEWTDFSDNDLGVLLVDMFAYACDITLYYQTRIANNLFPATADEPDALIQLLRLIGYELRPPAPAVANLLLSFDASETFPRTIPAGSVFTVSTASGAALVFETEREFQVQNAQLTPPDSKGFRHLLDPVPVVEGTTVTDEPDLVSDGTPNQLHTLARKPVVAGSIRVSVKETVQGGGQVVTETRWQETDSLATSSPGDRHFVVRRDAEGQATILFGDGVNGMIPPRNLPPSNLKIQVVYRVGGGTRGNVPAGTQFIPQLDFIRRATNPAPAAGGAAGEDIEQARALAPRLFRTQERAVTQQDYYHVALSVPGVSKARAVALSWNEVVLYVAPSGQVSEPSELLKRDLLAAFEGRRMVTTSLHIVGPVPVDIYLGAVVRARPYFLRADVQRAVEQAVAEYLALDAVDFGQPIYLSRIYDAIQSLESVSSLTVFKFSTTYAPLAGAPVVYDVEADGIIQLGPNQLPRPGYRDNPLTPANPADPSYATPIYIIMEGGVG